MCTVIFISIDARNISIQLQCYVNAGSIYLNVYASLSHIIFQISSFKQTQLSKCTWNTLYTSIYYANNQSERMSNILNFFAWHIKRNKITHGIRNSDASRLLFKLADLWDLFHKTVSWYDMFSIFSESLSTFFSFNKTMVLQMSTNISF